MNDLVGLLLEVTIALLATIEAGARAALGDPVFALYFLVVAVVTGLLAERSYRRFRRRRDGWS